MSEDNNFTYLLMLASHGSFISDFKSDIEINDGDKINYKGYELLVKYTIDNGKVLAVEKV